MILEALPVAVERDGWDWLLYALSLAAAVTAIVLFLPWALERRRRPEVGFHWKFSPDGDPANLTPWSAGYVPEIDPTQPFQPRGVRDETIGISVDCQAVWERKLEALREHRTQGEMEDIPFDLYPLMLGWEEYVIEWPERPPGAPVLGDVFEDLRGA